MDNQKDLAILSAAFLLIQYLVQNRCKNERQERVGKVKAIPTRPSVKYLTGPSRGEKLEKEAESTLVNILVNLSGEVF